MRRSSLALASVLVAGVVAVAPAAGAPEQTPKRGGTVVRGFFSDPTCLNPVDVACFLPFHFEKVLESAFVLGPDLTPRPQLVSSAAVTRMRPFTVTFEIHPDARWSDRVPVTSQDFVFTHDAIVEHVAPPELQDEHRLVRSIRRVGAKTVRVVLRSRTARWRALFPYVLPQHALRGEDLEKIWSDGIENPRTGAPIGSGPFLLQSWERGKRMTFVRNRNYWGPHTAYLDRIVFRLLPTRGIATFAEILAALRQGDVDITQTRDPAIISELRAIPGTKVLASRVNGLDHLALRLGPGGHPALKIKRVRRALAYGIDRVAIARTVLGELDPRYPASDSAVFVNTHRSYRPNWDHYRYRPALARRLLEQAGCRLEADGIYACAGERLSLSFVGMAGATFRVRALELIQRHLRQVGVEVRLSFAPAFTLLDQIVPSGAFDAVEFTWLSDGAIGADVYGCGGVNNFTGYCQRLVTRDLVQSDRILDAGRRARVLNGADAQLAKDVPVIPLFQTPIVIAFRSTIRNVVSAAGHELWNAENWWLAQPR